MDHKIWILLGLITLAAAVYMLYPFTSILVYGIFIYYITRPLYDRILPVLKSKSISALTSILILAVPVVLILLYTIGVASMEVKQLLTTTEFQSLRPSIAIVNQTSNLAVNIKVGEVLGLISEKGDATNKILDLIPELSSLIWMVISRALDMLFTLFLISTISFYLLVDGGGIRSWLKNTFFIKEDRADRFFDDVDFDLANIFHGNILTAGVIMVIAAVLFTIVNYVSPVISIPYPVLLGILCGIASLIPVVGVALIWGPLMVYIILLTSAKGLLAQTAPSIIVFFIATYVIADWLPNILLRPRMSGQRMHKGLLLLSYIFGPIVFGLKGLFLGPIVLVFAINYAEIIIPELVRGK